MQYCQWELGCTGAGLATAELWALIHFCNSTRTRYASHFHSWTNFLENHCWQ